MPANLQVSLICTLSPFPFVSSFLLSSRAFSLHRKCSTGIKNKLSLGSAVPASMLYHAKKPATIPKAPPALVNGTSGMPFGSFWASSYVLLGIWMTRTTFRYCQLTRKDRVEPLKCFSIHVLHRLVHWLLHTRSERTGMGYIEILAARNQCRYSG